MDATEERIEQFRQMAKANPEDDLAHFAFANALMNAGRVAEAAPVLRHVVRINSGYSRAYLLLGEALEANGDDEGAIEAWQRGRLIAMRRGELMAGNEMKTRLEERDAPLSSEEAELLLIDDPAPPEEERPLLAGEVRCLRSGRIGAAMLDNPFDDELGAFIQKKISQESWEGWIEMSIKVINELRLDLGGSKSGSATVRCSGIQTLPLVRCAVRCGHTVGAAWATRPKSNWRFARRRRDAVPV